MADYRYDGIIDMAFNSDMGLIQEYAEGHIGNSQELDEIIERFIDAACELRAYALIHKGADEFFIEREKLQRNHAKEWQKLERTWRDDEADEETRKTAEKEYMDALRALKMHKR